LKPISQEAVERSRLGSNATTLIVWLDASQSQAGSHDRQIDSTFPSGRWAETVRRVSNMSDDLERVAAMLVAKDKGILARARCNGAASLGTYTVQMEATTAAATPVHRREWRDD
jgi:hypothetical protein